MTDEIEKTRREVHRDLFDALDRSGYLRYGNIIPADIVRSIIGLEYPELGTKREFDSLSLRELAAIDYVRDNLLKRGMYLSQVVTGYRILTPEENAHQVQRYISTADRKLCRALKLSRNTPPIAGSVQADQTESRIAMKRMGLKRAA